MKKSKYVGVTWHNKCQEWRIQIVFNKEQIYVGSTKDEEKAAQMYADANFRFTGKREFYLRPVTDKTEVSAP